MIVATSPNSDANTGLRASIMPAHTLTVSDAVYHSQERRPEAHLGTGGTRDRSPVRHRVDSAMVKALAHGFRWRKRLETGTYGTIEELAGAEKINASYVSRVLRMTLLAPDIVEAILDGRHFSETTLAKVMQPFPSSWTWQNSTFSPPKGR